MRFLLVFLVLLGISCAYIRISVMLPLNAITYQGVTNSYQLQQNLNKLKSGGVDAVMTDVWWGIVENNGPQQYNWTSYLQLVQLVANAGLKMQVVMSFHQCGTNVGDQCYVPLPKWVLAVGQQNSDIFYKDQNYNVDQEYLSLGVDNQTVLAGRSGVQVYSDFMQSFAQTFSQYLGSTINQVQVGMGPAGELRYPSYQLQQNRWSYCGIGAFQCYDKYMLTDLKNSASAAGHPEWGNGGPNNAGYYNSHPGDTGFFNNGNDNYQSDYGRFFLGWYSSKLVNHGSNILAQASAIFKPYGTPISAKVSGIHWWYSDPSHAAEVTAGYYNTNQNDAYYQLSQMFSQYDAVFDFTCLEMYDTDTSCDSQPVELVRQTRLAANKAQIGYAGENALQICYPGGCDQSKFDQVVKESTQYGDIERFTFLRLDDDLLNNQNEWNSFVSFVSRMHNSK